MAASKLEKANEKIAGAVVGGYKKIESGVTGAFKKVEDGFVEKFLAHEGETVEDAEKRLSAKPPENSRSPHAPRGFLRAAHIF